MTPRISLRPAGLAALLLSFAAVVLTLICAANLTIRSGVDSLLASSPAEGAESSRTLAPANGVQKHSVKSRTGSTASSPASHRSSAQNPERRLTAAALGQSAEIHYPGGGSPDIPIALASRNWFFPADLVDLPVDASAEVVATTVSLSQRGRAPPTAYGV